MDTAPAAILIVVVLLLFLGTGLWVFASMILTAVVSLYFVNDFDATRIGFIMHPVIQRSVTTYEVAALPMFIWMAEILFKSRLSEQIFRGLAPWLDWLPGRLFHVNVIGCGIFGSVSGSSTATCATIARIALPELKRRGYNERMSIGSLAGAGTLGILIPPSISMVIYAITANVSLIQLFLAGFLPAVLVMALFSGYIALRTTRNPEWCPPSGVKLSLSEKLHESRQLIPTLLLIAFIFVALVWGLVTPNECAAWGVVGSLAVTYWSGGLSWQSFWRSAVGAARITCMILIIVASASLLSAAMAYSLIPAKMATFVGTLGLAPIVLILALTLVYVVLGTALDGVSLIVLTAPVVIPLVTQAGYDLVWFGIYMVMVIEMAEISPPVGFNLFVLQNMTGHSNAFVSLAALPFFILLVFAVFVISLFPDVVMVLPRIAFPLS